MYGDVGAQLAKLKEHQPDNLSTTWGNIVPDVFQMNEVRSKIEAAEREIEAIKRVLRSFVDYKNDAERGSYLETCFEENDPYRFYIRCTVGQLQEKEGRLQEEERQLHEEKNELLKRESALQRQGGGVAGKALTQSSTSKNEEPGLLSSQLGQISTQRCHDSDAIAINSIRIKGPATRLYVVGHWQSGLRKEVPFTKGDHLTRLLVSIGIAFNLARISRLYALYPGMRQDERVKIGSTEQLHAILDDIDTGRCDPEVLYVYPEDCSPNAPDAASRALRMSAVPTKDAFRKEVKRRDKKCLLCNTESVLVACHIVDDKAKLSSEEEVTLGMFEACERYAIYNGLTLCANCHSMYDHWQHGIDEDGYLVKWDKKLGWTRDNTVNVYSDPSNKTSSPKNPLSILLKWKFDRFVLNRDKTSTRIYNAIRDSFPFTKSKKASDI